MKRQILDPVKMLFLKCQMQRVMMFWILNDILRQNGKNPDILLFPSLPSSALPSKHKMSTSGLNRHKSKHNKILSNGNEQQIMKTGSQVKRSCFN